MGSSLYAGSAQIVVVVKSSDSASTRPAGIEVGDKPPPYEELDTEHTFSGEDDALTTEL